jgi:hypothetical protein
VNVNGGTKPARRITLITPGSSFLSPVPRSLYIAASGTISVTGSDDVAADLIPVFAGTVLPIRPRKVTAATATVYGLYEDEME